MEISDVAINISNNYNLSISRSLEIEAKALKNIELIESGFKFGEEDVYDPGCYFEFKLLELDKSKLKMVCNEPGNNKTHKLNALNIACLFIDN